MDFSKPLLKADDDAKLLIIEALDGSDTHGFDVDSIFYNDPRGWTVIEFLKCVTVRPHKSDPNRYWNQCWRKVTALWALTQALDGVFYWVTYEVSREQFSILKVEAVDREEGMKAKRKDTDWSGFRDWYRDLNDNPLPLW